MGRVKPVAKGAEKKVRKPRKKKDKDAPKRPCTSFFFYVLQQRAKGAHEGMKVAEFTKQCGANWRAFNDEEKSDYHSKAAVDRKRYDADMKLYKPSSVKDATKPKKPMTPFLLYVGSVRKDLLKDGCQHKEVLGQAAANWRPMNEEEKKPFVKQAEALKKQHLLDMEKWNSDNAKAAKAASATGKAAQKNGKESESESGEEEDESEEEEEDDDDDMDSDDE